MKNNMLEFIVVAFVIICAALFFTTAYKYSAKQNNSANSYDLYASFDRADGISVGSEVKIAGIIIGYVQEAKLDLKNYNAKIRLNIENNIKIPLDSSANIISDGLLGGKFIDITIGGDEGYLIPGGFIKYTTSSMNLENLIGKMVFGKDGAKAN